MLMTPTTYRNTHGALFIVTGCEEGSFGVTIIVVDTDGIESGISLADFVADFTQVKS